jgi:hypothetical protein
VIVATNRARAATTASDHGGARVADRVNAKIDRTTWRPDHSSQVSSNLDAKLRVTVRAQLTLLHDMFVSTWSWA